MTNPHANTITDQGGEDDQLDMDAVRAWLARVAAEPKPRPGQPATRAALAAWANRVG